MSSSEHLLPPKSDSVLTVDKVSKRYEIYERPQDRLKQSLVPRLAALIPASRWRSRSYFKEFWALRDVSFALGRGEVLGILGRNGAGKSTLLQIVAGTLAPTSGTVHVHGKVAALLELGSGFSPEFTGRENVRLNATLLGLASAEIDRRFDEIEAFADIGDFIEQPVKTYSSGMMMRLAFAVQTAVEPELLIVDEALAVGDARFQKKCIDQLETLRRKGTTILFVTHDSGTIVRMCTRALIIEKGRIYADGTPQVITREYHRLMFGQPEITSKPTAVAGSESSAVVLPSKPDAASPIPQQTGVLQAGHVNETRYGNREVEVIEIGIRNNRGEATRLLEIHDEATFYFLARFNKAINEKVGFGFIVADRKGAELYGTKAAFFDCLLPPSEQGKVYECELSVRMMAVPGFYFLTVALAADDEEGAAKYYDYRFDALQFQVVGTPKCFTTSSVDLAGKMKIRECPREAALT